MHNSCLFILKCQLVKTYLKGSLPREAQGAGGARLQRQLQKVTAFLAKLKPRAGEMDPPLSGGIVAPLTRNQSCGSQWHPPQRVHLPPTEGFALLPGLILAQTVPVLLGRRCNQRGRATGTLAGQAGGRVDPSTGCGAAGISQDRAAVTVVAGMQPRVQAGHWELPTACPPLLTSANLPHLGRGGEGGREINYQ